MNLIIDSHRDRNGRVDGSILEERSGTDRVTIEKGSSQVKESRGAFALDISGTVMDNTAYEGHGRTTEDVMQDAGQVDVATQKNYMAVMSNSMSAEDFAKLQEEGTPPGKTEIETVVTIVDEIKAALLRGGKNIAGYTDDMDVATLREITGNEALADEIIKEFRKNDIPVTKENVEDVMEACAQAAGLGEMSDDARRYMVANHMEPSVDNIYLAQYSTRTGVRQQSGASTVSRNSAEEGRQENRPGSHRSGGYYRDGGGYYARRAEETDWDNLRPQMEKVIENAGLTVTEETMESAKWLIEKGIPLNEENLSSLYELEHLDMPKEPEQAVPAAAAAIHDGKSAKEANLYDSRTDAEKALEYEKDFRTVSDEAADLVAAEGKTLNLCNLKLAQSRLEDGNGEAGSAVDRDGRWKLEEIRLKMTVEANLRLLRNGINIETEELSRLVKELETAQQERDCLVFGGETAEAAKERSDLYRNTLSVVSGIPGLPAAVSGRFAIYGATAEKVRASVPAFTLEGVHREGNALKSAYEKAGESYEELMTAPRADLGDSIKKAFRNVDNLLREMEMEVTDANRRAVRILGYNNMAISEENIIAVKTTDTTIRRVAEKMTPSSTMRMIREGVNPLTMDMEELENYLDRQQKEPEQEFSRYGEYLYKLQKNGNITEDERDSYIGIYRLFRQLQKTDGAAIGALMEQGAEPTVGNLLSAMRSSKKHGMDITVDDSFGGMTGSYKGKSITEQIMSSFGDGADYQKKLANDILEHLDGGRMSPQMLDGDLSLEELSAMLRQAGENPEADRDYIRQQTAQMREAGKSDEAVIKELLAFKQPVTTDYLIAGGLLMKERGKLAGRMKELAEETERQKPLKESIDSLQESLDDRENAQKAYDGLERTYTDILEEAVYGEESGGRLDLKEISNLYKQISLAANLAREENYEVPVEINGEMTSINLKLIHGGQETGRVSASMEADSIGKVMAQFHISEQSEGAYGLSGYIACNREETVQKLEQSVEELKKALKQTDINVNSLNVICHKELDLVKALPSDDGKKQETAAAGESKKTVPASKLYQSAKAFIGYIREDGNLSDMAS